MEILLANPRGFCAGVDRAISIVEVLLQRMGAPIYVRHEIVHNRYVVNDLKRKGAIFIEDLNEVPPNSVLVFSAHGVSKSVQEAAKKRNLRIFDATCPLVIKVHKEVIRMHEEGKVIIMIGHAGHPEVEGTMGQVPGQIYLVENTEQVSELNFPPNLEIGYVTQTTLSVDEAHAIIAALKARFPQIRAPKKEDICYATQNRQDAVKQLAQTCDFIIVVGSPNSSNSNRLREVALKHNVSAIMIDDIAQIDPIVVKQFKKIGITAGASAPEVLVASVVSYLKTLGAEVVVREALGVEEKIVFVMPKDLA